jgi:hypothetical protein
VRSSSGPPPPPPWCPWPASTWHRWRPRGSRGEPAGFLPGISQLCADDGRYGGGRYAPVERWELLDSREVNVLTRLRHPRPDGGMAQWACFKAGRTMALFPVEGGSG